MIARSRELLLGVILLISLGGGLAFEVLSDEAEKPPPGSVPGDLFTARAVFCPPSIRRADTFLMVASVEANPVPVEIKPGGAEVADLGAERFLLHHAEARASADVTGFGSPLKASASTRLVEPVQGAGAAACTETASTAWYFAEGSSALDYDERLLIYNPFPDEAVVQVTLFGPKGDRTRANLSDIAVPARGSVVVSLNEFVLRQKFLSTTVTATRGRVVAWRALLATPENRAQGVQLSLGAPATAPEWYFPDGAVGDGYEERLAVLNPSDQEAIVTISLVTNKKTIQPPKLLELGVPPESSRSVVLKDVVEGRQGELGTVGAVVRSTNGVGIVSERTVWYATGRLEGVASEVGSAQAASDWWLGPALVRPQVDVVAVMNPGTADVRVTISFLRRFEDPLIAKRLTDIVVRRDARIRIPVDATTGGAPTVALVHATGPVVAERFAYSGWAADVAAVMGMPVPGGP
jgi:hypothetical protein